MGFYINLDNRIDRKNKIEQQFIDFNITNVIRHPANKTTNSGPQNCKLSHYEVYRKFLDSDHDRLLVLEDDCLFLPYLYENTSLIHHNMMNIDFDLFWMGCRNRRAPKFYSHNFYRVQSVSHAQSYIINRNLCQYLIDNFPVDQYNTLAIDELLCLIIFDFKIVCDPNSVNYYQMDNPLDNLSTHFNSVCYERALTTQYKSYSDLWKIDSDYESYITSSYPVPS